MLRNNNSQEPINNSNKKEKKSNEGTSETDKFIFNKEQQDNYTKSTTSYNKSQEGKNSLPVSPSVKSNDKDQQDLFNIDNEDNYDLSIMLKSQDYYNTLNSKISQLLHTQDDSYPPPPPSNSMMDYISRSQPLYGGSNLLAQYIKFHHDSKGKEPEQGEPESKVEHMPEEIKKPFSRAPSYPNSFSSFTPLPVHQTQSSTSPPPPRSWSSHMPIKATENIHFDPSVNTIPSFKGRKRKQSHGPGDVHNPLHFNSPLNNDLHLPIIPKTQEPLHLDDEDNDNENDNDNEPLMMKSSPHNINASNGAGKTKPIKKSIRVKRRSSRPPPPSPMNSYYGSFGSYGSYGSHGPGSPTKFEGPYPPPPPMNSSVLAKTSRYIPDASLPYLVKTIDSHLIHSESQHSPEDENMTEPPYNIYKLKGGDVTRDIYNFNEKIKRTILSKRSKSEPNLYELNKRRENEFNISEISIPGGFRREFIRSNAKKHGKTPPHWITSNFIDFLALYGHYAGDDDFDEDYYSDNYDTEDYWEEDEEDEEEEINMGENEMDVLNHHHQFENDIYTNYFDDEKIKIIETQSSYEVLSEEEVKIQPTTENTPLLPSTSQSSLNHRRKNKSKKQRKNNSSSSQTGTASEGKTLFLLLKAFIGTGILFLPKAFANGGLLFSLVLLALSGWLTYFTMVLLIRCSEKFGGSYGDIGKQLFGKPFKYMIQASIALTQSGFCCAYIIFILQSIQSIISTVTNDTLVIPDWAIIIAQVLIYIPLSWIRKIQNFSITSLVADIFILVGLLYIICSDLIIISTEKPSSNFSLFNSEKFPLFLGTAIFAFEGIGLIIPLQRSMREPEKFPKVLKKSMYIIFIAMFVVGSLSYYIFGDEVNTIIFMSVFPESVIGTVVRALYTLAIIFSFPLTCYSGIHIIEPLFIPRQRPFKSFQLKRKRMRAMNYTAVTTTTPVTSNRSSTEMLIPSMNKVGYDFDPPNSSNSKMNSRESLLPTTPSPSNGDLSSSGLTPSSSYSSLPVRSKPKRDTGKNSKMIKWMKNIFRAFFVSGLGLVSYYGASNLDNFVSIIGSSACIPLMFIYPAMMHYRGVAETSSERAIDVAIIIFGVISTVWITKLSLADWK